jgi:hypothetical protein
MELKQNFASLRPAVMVGEEIIVGEQGLAQ